MTTDEYLSPLNFNIEYLIAANDRLNAAVVERIIESQELVLLNNFAIESTEFQFKNTVQSRIAEVETWRYVLTDLSERLIKAKGYLQHEHKALGVVVQRILKEIKRNTQGLTQPGELYTSTDIVELAVLKEVKFLKKQKSKFEALIRDLEKQMKQIERTRKGIENDVLNKEKSVNVEEKCSKEDRLSIQSKTEKKKVKKKHSSYDRWEARCKLLKENGLEAISKTIFTRQQLRGARIELSIKSQAYATRVDAVLRRRLHSNQAKLQELAWQRDEAVRDHETLQEELLTTKKTILENMEQERVVEMRLIERTNKPAKERVRDDVDKKLREELARIRRFVRDLKENVKRITTLQKALVEVIDRIDCAGQDIHQVIRLDQERIRNRMGEPSKDSGETCYQYAPTKKKCLEKDSNNVKIQQGAQRATGDGAKSPRDFCLSTLEPIAEEKDESEGEEYDDYPLDY